MGSDELDDEDIAERLRQSIGRFTRTVRAQANTLPLGQAAVLGVLAREGPRTIAQLAADRQVKHQSMSRTVGELEALGFVRRAADPTDGRSFLITMTAAGTKAVNMDRKRRRRWVADTIAAELSARERRILHTVPDLLDRLSAAGD